MDPVLLVGGVLFVLWPLQYRWSMRHIRRKLAQRGGDVEGFDRAMDRPWMRGMLVAAPVVGALLIVAGILG